MIRTHEHDYRSIYGIDTVAVIVRDTQHALCFSPIGWVYQLPSVQEVGNKYQVNQWHAWQNKVPGSKQRYKINHIMRALAASNPTNVTLLAVCTGGHPSGSSVGSFRRAGYPQHSLRVKLRVVRVRAVCVRVRKYAREYRAGETYSSLLLPGTCSTVGTLRAPVAGEIRK